MITTIDEFKRWGVLDKDHKIITSSKKLKIGQYIYLWYAGESFLYQIISNDDVKKHERDLTIQEVTNIINIYNK